MPNASTPRNAEAAQDTLARPRFRAGKPILYTL